MNLRYFYLLNVCIAFGIVLATKLQPDTLWLEQATIENGPYEVATAIILLIGSIGLAWQWAKLSGSGWQFRLGCAAMALLCFVGAGEEISWGQHWLKFQAGEFFQTHSYQKETNLHNLMNPVLFSTIINVVLYSAFILFPFVHWAFPSNLLSKQLRKIEFDGFIPSITVAILLMLAHCFHGWLIPAVYSDTAALIGCWLFGLILMIFHRKQLTSSFLWIAMLICGLGFIIGIYSADIFRHANLQYEIRECFTAFVLVYWAFGWSGLLKGNASI